LDDPAVADMHQVDAPNRSAIAEMETPTDGGVVPHHDRVLDVETGNRVGGKHLPECKAGVLARVSRAVRGWLDRPHDAMRRDQIAEQRRLAIAERLVEAKDDFGGFEHWLNSSNTDRSVYAVYRPVC